MANELSISTILSNTWNSIYSILTDSSSGLTDTQSSARTRTTWVFSSFPDEYDDDGATSADFPGYPVVVIETNSDASLFTLGQGKREASVSVEINIFTKKAVDLDTLSDDVINHLMNSSQSTLESKYLFSPTMEGTLTNTMFRDKDKIHQRSLRFSFRWVG